MMFAEFNRMDVSQSRSVLKRPGKHLERPSTRQAKLTFHPLKNRFDALKTEHGSSDVTTPMHYP